MLFTCSKGLLGRGLRCELRQQHAELLCLHGAMIIVQVHGGAGVCDDFPLAALWSGARTLRLADGPDDVHLVSIAKLELAKLSKL